MLPPPTINISGGLSRQIEAKGRWAPRAALRGCEHCRAGSWSPGRVHCQPDASLDGIYIEMYYILLSKKARHDTEPHHSHSEHLSPRPLPAIAWALNPAGGLIGSVQGGVTAPRVVGPWLEGGSSYVLKLKAVWISVPWLEDPSRNWQRSSGLAQCTLQGLSDQGPYKTQSWREAAPRPICETPWLRV